LIDLRADSHQMPVVCEYPAFDPDSFSDIQPSATDGQGVRGDSGEQTGKIVCGGGRLSPEGARIAECRNPKESALTVESESTIYFRHETNLFRAFKDAGFEPRVFFDIGSSNSGWSFQMADLFPNARFHLFEPLVDHKAFYRENTAHILQERPDFQVHKVAIGAVNGTAKMGVDESGYSASTLVTETNATFTGLIEVPIRRLDTFVFEQNLPRPEVLKIDVQGGELGVLIGAGSLLDNVQLIQAEVWLMRRYGSQTPLLHEILEYLTVKNFLLIGFGGSYYGDLHELYATDAFFARIDFLNRLSGRLPASSLTGVSGA
jgi:FkbM family methyltransferase